MFLLNETACVSEATLPVLHACLRSIRGGLDIASGLILSILDQERLEDSSLIQTRSRSEAFATTENIVSGTV